MIKFVKRMPEDGKSCFDIQKKGEGFRGIIRYFKETKEWARLSYPSGRIERFDSLAEAKEEALKI